MNEKKPKVFAESSIHKLDDSEKPHFWFEAAMVSSCPGCFDGCHDNYEVEERLRRAGVIHAKTKTDTESSALVVMWSSRKSGLAFLTRLNAFLADDRAQKLAAVPPKKKAAR